MKEFAAIRRYKDTPSDFAVMEYFSTQAEAEAWIAAQPKSHFYQDEVGHYE